MSAPPIRDQLDAVSECLVVAERHGISRATAEHVNAAIRTLRWVAKNRDLFKEFALLERTEEVQALKSTFPGARVSAIRRTR